MTSISETLDKLRFVFVEALFISLIGAVGGVVGGVFAYVLLAVLEWTSR